MQEAGYLAQKQGSPTGLALIVLAHAGALGALALAKGPEIIDSLTNTMVTMVEVEPPPPIVPPPQPDTRQQIPPEQVTSVPPVFERITQGPVVPDLPPTPPQPPQPPQETVLVRADPPIPRASLPQRARANLGGYFSTDDYPAAALRAEAEGTARFTLAIGTDGRVTNCTITGSSGNSALDGATCRILRSRARYAPARDQNRNPVSGTDRGSVTWRLPAE